MKSWFLEKTNKSLKVPAKWTKPKKKRVAGRKKKRRGRRRKRHKLPGMTQGIPYKPLRHQKNNGGYRQLYTHKFDNFGEMDQFFRKHKLPLLTQYETDL